MEATFFEAIQAGGNVAVMAIAVAIWRIDRRVLRLELKAGVLVNGQV